jgi:hypothetical protein
MSDDQSGDEVGYKKVPRNRQYKKGDRANPLGRGAKKRFEAGDKLDQLRKEKIVGVVAGKKKSLSRPEWWVKQLRKRALTDKHLNSAEILIDEHKRSETRGDFECSPKTVTKGEAKMQRLIRKFTSI